MHGKTLSDRTVIILTVLARFAFTYSAARAMMAQPMLVAVDELTPRASAYIEANPNDAAGYFALGRIHYLATWTGTGHAGVWQMPSGQNPVPQVIPEHFEYVLKQLALMSEARRQTLADFGVKEVGQIDRKKIGRFYKAVSQKAQALKQAGWQPEGLNAEALAGHTKAAIANLTKAVELDDDNGLYVHNLARAIEQRAEQLTDDADAAEHRNRATELYLQAYELTKKADRTRDVGPTFGLAELTSHNAAQGYMRLMADDESAADQIKAMQAHMPRPMMMP